MNEDRRSGADPSHEGDDHDEGDLVARLTALADRFDALADTAELMGDPAALARFRADAASCRLRAMAKLDESPTEGA